MKNSNILRGLLFVFLSVNFIVVNAMTNGVGELSPEIIKLKRACQVLVNKPQSQGSLEVLFEYAKNTNSVDRLRSRAMAAFALSTLFKGDTNLFLRAQESHTRKYPDDKSLLKVNLSSCYSICEECRGKGRILGECPRCNGRGICPACRGKGQTLARKNLKGRKDTGVRCSLCKGTGKCPKCRGTGTQWHRCPKCKGRPAPFKPSDEIYQDFVMIIKGMIKWVDNEEFFYQRYQQAEDEQDPIKKQLLLNALVADYKYRPEIKHIELLLDSAEKISRAKKRAEYAKADKLKKEFDFLKNLKVSENISGAIITLRNYLEENPETEHKVELKAILNHLVDKLAKQKSRKRLYYSLGGIFLLLFGLSCIQINHCKYTIFSRNKPFEGQED